MHMFFKFQKFEDILLSKWSVVSGFLEILLNIFLKITSIQLIDLQIIKTEYINFRKVY